MVFAIEKRPELVALESPNVDKAITPMASSRSADESPRPTMREQWCVYSRRRQTNLSLKEHVL